ncbi:MAG: two-component regulator propeller domain-containing protein [Bacteroidota bacterium]
MVFVFGFLLFLFQLQPEHRVSQHLNTGTGLSNNIVHTVFQDTKGFIWIGTDSGLNRFDGYDIITFFNQPDDSTSLSSNTIRSIIEDKNGTMWIGSYNGLNRYDPVSNSFEQFITLPDKPNSRLDLQEMIYDEKTHRIWFNTLQTGGWFDLDERTFHFLSTEMESFSITEHPQGILMLSKESNIYLIHPETTHLTPVGMLKKDHLTPIYYGKESEILWVSGYEELRKDVFPNPKTIPASLISEYAFSFLEIDEHRIWMGTEQGLFEVDHAQGTVKQIELTEEPSFLTTSISSLFKDSGGGVWVGTLGGLFYLNSTQSHFRHIDVKPESADVIMAMKEEYDQSIVLNLFSTGLVQYQRESGLMEEHPASSGLSGGGLQIWDIETVPDSDFEYWFATNDGLILFNTELNQVEQRVYMEKEYYSNVVFSIQASDEHSMYVSSLNNIHELDKTSGKQIRMLNTEDFVKQSNIQDLLLLDHHLYVATEGSGLAKVDLVTEEVSEIGADLGLNNPLKNNAIWDIYLSHDRTLWIGTARGLFHYDPESDQLSPIRFDANINDRIVYSILEHEDQLWMGTGSGLVQINPINQTSAVFGASEGVVNFEFNRRSALNTQDGLFFFGGVEGITAFDPSFVTQTRTDPPLHILKMEVFTTDSSFVPPSFSEQQVVLPWYENTIEFSYAALNYSNPELMHYRYRLKGMDDNWVENSENRKARYAQLPPGEYEFDVQASGSFNFSNAKESRVLFTVHPPLWQTPLFKAGTAALILLFLWGLYRYRVSHLLKLERIRLSIARDLHDEVGSGLSGIALSGDILSHKLEQEKYGNTLQLQKISENARALASSLDGIVWMIDPNKELLGDFISKCRSLSNEMLPHHELSFSSGIPENRLDITLSSDKKRHLFLFFKESLNNIRKHADATSVNIDFELAEKGMGIRIVDNGVGFDTGIPSSGNGIASIKQRAQELKADLSIESELQQGTHIELTVKLP